MAIQLFIIRTIASAMSVNMVVIVTTAFLYNIHLYLILVFFTYT